MLFGGRSPRRTLGTTRNKKAFRDIAGKLEEMGVKLQYKRVVDHSKISGADKKHSVSLTQWMWFLKRGLQQTEPKGSSRLLLNSLCAKTEETGKF